MGVFGSPIDNRASSSFRAAPAASITVFSASSSVTRRPLWNSCLVCNRASTSDRSPKLRSKRTPRRVSNARSCVKVASNVLLKRRSGTHKTTVFPRCSLMYGDASRNHEMASLVLKRLSVRGFWASLAVLCGGCGTVFIKLV